MLTRPLVELFTEDKSELIIIMTPICRQEEVTLSRILKELWPLFDLGSRLSFSYNLTIPKPFKTLI